MEQTLYKAKEMAEMLRCNPQTIYRMADKGLLGSVKVGNLRRFYFLEEGDKTNGKEDDAGRPHP